MSDAESSSEIESDTDSGGSSETETSTPGPYSFSPVIPSQEAVQMGITLMIVMMTDSMVGTTGTLYHA